MASKQVPTLSQEQFDDLYTWLQEHRETRLTRVGLKYRCDHTFTYTRQWLELYGLDVERYLTHLRTHHLTCDCAILQQLTDWP